jgi:hypothetical protein
VQRGVPSPLRHCSTAARRYSSRDAAPRARRRRLTQLAPLAELTRLKAHHLDPNIDLLARGRSRIARVRWHAHVAALIRPLSSSPPRHRCTDKTPFSVASMPALPLLPSLRSTPHERMLALPPRQAEPSLPSLSPCVGPRCLYAIHSYKRDLPRAFCPRPHRSLPPVSRHRHTAFVFCRCVGAKLPHPTSLPVRRSRSSARPQSCSRTRSNHTFTAVELRRRRPRW